MREVYDSSRRNINDTYRSKPAIKIAKWIRDIGFLVEEEYPVGKYSVDIYIPSLHVAVEVDGPYHFKDKDKKRDAVLLDRHHMPTVRFSTKVKREVVEEKLEEVAFTFRSTADERIMLEEMNS